MAVFGATSRERMKDLHPKLVEILKKSILIIDFAVVQTHRSVAEQQRLYAQGRTLPGPIVTHIDGVRRKSKHNHKPSLAADCCPWKPGVGLDWNDRESFSVMGGVFLAIAQELHIDVRWGGNWDEDAYFREKGDNWDMPHLELMVR